MQLEPAVSDTAFDDIIYYDDPNEFLEKLKAIGAQEEFDQKWKDLEALASPVSEQRHHFFLEMKPGFSTDDSCIDLFLKKGDFRSKAFERSFFEKESEQKVQHCFVEAFDCSEMKTPLLSLRLSKDNAELIWVQKAKSISGHDLFSLFKAIVDAFQIDVYLYDDSKLYHEYTVGSKAKNEFLNLKNISAIAFGTSVYEKSLGFSLLESSDISLYLQNKGAAHSVRLTQKKHEYSKALSELQDWTLRDLKKNYSPLYRKNWTLVEGIAKTAFKGESIAEKTLAHLSSALLSGYRKRKSKKLFQSLRCLERNLLTPWDLPESFKEKEAATRTISDYLKSLKHLSSARVYVLRAKKK